MRWWREKFPAPAGTRTPDHPARNLALCHWAIPAHVHFYIYDLISVTAVLWIFKNFFPLLLKFLKCYFISRNKQYCILTPLYSHFCVNFLTLSNFLWSFQILYLNRCMYVYVQLSARRLVGSSCSAGTRCAYPHIHAHAGTHKYIYSTPHITTARRTKPGVEWGRVASSFPPPYCTQPGNDEVHYLAKVDNTLNFANPYCEIPLKFTWLLQARPMFYYFSFEIQNCIQNILNFFNNLITCQLSYLQT
jgi:hypothetical protein